MKWAVLRNYADAEIMKNCYICCESLRNGYSQLMCNLSSWIPTVLSFKDWSGFEFAYDLWVSLGVDNEVCDVLVDLQMHFEDDHLFVADKYSGSD